MLGVAQGTPGAGGVELTFTPTFNAVEVGYAACVAPGALRVSTARPAHVERAAREDHVTRILAQGTCSYVLACPLLDSGRGPGGLDALPRVALQLVGPVGGAAGPSGGARRRGASAGSGSEDGSDESDGSGDRAAAAAAASAAKGEAAGEAVLSPAEPAAGFHFLEPGHLYSVVVALAGDGGADGGPADVLRVDSGLLGRVSASSRRRSWGLWPTPDAAPKEDGLCVELVVEGSVRSEDLPPGRGAQPVACSGRGPALAVFNFRTRPGPPGLPPKVTRSLLLPWHRPGPWMLALRGDYAYAASLGKDFVVGLLQHGFFVLPGNDQLFACPFPVTPFLFKLQEAADKEAPANGNQDAPGSSWRRSKMLRRYGKDFELSCNLDLRRHLLRCGEYHQARGGTWISERLADLLVRIHEDPANPVRVYAFELWDKATGELAAASFGLSIGAFFHDFSMCCLVKDRRSAGAILSKAVGALLTDCGVIDWYWGCKVKYMEEYAPHGAREIPRREYYERLRAAMQRQLLEDPADAIRAGKAVIAPRAQ